MECSSCGYQYPDHKMTTTIEYVDDIAIHLTLCTECYEDSQKYRSD